MTYLHAVLSACGPPILEAAVCRKAADLQTRRTGNYGAKACGLQTMAADSLIPSRSLPNSTDALSLKYLKGRKVHQKGRRPMLQALPPADCQARTPRRSLRAAALPQRGAASVEQWLETCFFLLFLVLMAVACPCSDSSWGQAQNSVVVRELRLQDHQACFQFPSWHAFVRTWLGAFMD